MRKTARCSLLVAAPDLHSAYPETGPPEPDPVLREMAQRQAVGFLTTSGLKRIILSVTANGFRPYQNQRGTK